MSWHLGPLVGFDTETTGIDVDQDRIVTAALLDTITGEETHRQTWFATPGIEIPEQATAIHGISTAHAREHGRPAAEVVKEIAQALAERVAAGVPVVAMNARFDLTLLDRELHRYGLPPLAELAGREPLVICPYVIDKAMDRYRKGSRKLIDLAQLHGVQLGDDAHDAGADALAAVRVAIALAERYRVLRVDAGELNRRQVLWAGMQARSLEQHLRETDPAAVVRPEWPLIPRQQDGGAQ